MAIQALSTPTHTQVTHAVRRYHPNLLWRKIMNIKSNFNRNSIILLSVSLFIALIGKFTGISVIIYLSDVMIFLVAILCGPWVGFLTGAISLLIFTGGAIPVIYYNSGTEPMYRSGYPEWLLYAFMGFVVGILAQKGLFKKWWYSIIAGYLTAVGTTFLFIVLGQLFDRNATGFLSLPQIAEILMAFPLAFFSVLDSMDTNFPATHFMSIALISFAVLKLPIAQWKIFIQGCPQPESASAQLETTSRRIIIITGIFFLLSIVIYFGWLLIFGLAVSG